MTLELQTKGYYVGQTSEIIDTMDLFKNHINNLKGISITKERYRYVYSVNKPFIPHELIPDLKPGTLIESEIKERDEFVKKYDADVTQKWWILIDEDRVVNDLKFYLRDKIENFIFDLYPDLKDNIHHNDSITLYEEGDFNTTHVDGNSNGRRCVVLIYLSDEKDYNDGGGELVINNFSVTPLNYNYCIMDCQNHDLPHSINKIKNGFKRFTYVNFIYNKKDFENK